MAARRGVAALAGLVVAALAWLSWFAVPRTFVCGWFCYTPIVPGRPVAPLRTDAAPLVRHTSTAVASLPWPVLALLGAVVLGAVAFAALPRLAGACALLAGAALVAVLATALVGQPGLHARRDLAGADDPLYRLSDEQVDVRWPADATAAALAALLLATSTASGSPLRALPRRRAGRPPAAARPT